MGERATSRLLYVGHFLGIEADKLNDFDDSCMETRDGQKKHR
jgi:hypothetical protein